MLTDHSPATGPTTDTFALDWVPITLGAVAVACVAVADPTVGATLAMPLIGAAVLALGDQRTGRIPNRHSALLFAATLVVTTIGSYGLSTGSVAGSLAGAAIWSVPLFVMAVIGSFGGGDFKLAASLGAMCGWISIPTAVVGLIGGLAMCCAAGVVVAWRARTMNTPLHLGLPLYIGTAATIVIAAS